MKGFPALLNVTAIRTVVLESIFCAHSPPQHPTRLLNVPECAAQKSVSYDYIW